ncbi:MAG: GNAT family N-acetyltransferase [Candidatus Cloacimonetes bacterium]|nr:GNAT family N-acetyltransferase [Candidatus Cloacimonadota bacterium]MCF7814268.1 GNAT family N-acetyltransferase [Candidatus Cloacimonadota bacterium]MCF7868929.1 GNAT family N-acetyltransferase [Candidatus Cloacimonadota bacterium]MCF7884310.1 GNAT family N-acetyltransferase [Candidatus Cloacimonadota bacterium]
MLDFIKKQKNFYNMEKINPKPCFHAQIGLEGLQIVNGNRIVKIHTDHFDIEKNENAKPPKIIAVNFGKEINIFYSDKMPNSLVANLEKLEKHSFLDEQEKVIEILKRNKQFNEAGHYIAYIFPSDIQVDTENTKIFIGSEDEAIKQFDPTFYKKYPIVYATIQNDEIAACCVSSRENNKAGEAWIFTLPKYRKQGFGLKAVQLWASELQKQGKIPLYTHEISNIASQKLAEKLDLIKVLENVSYE